MLLESVVILGDSEYRKDIITKRTLTFGLVKSRDELRLARMYASSPKSLTFIHGWARGFGPSIIGSYTSTRNFAAGYRMLGYVYKTRLAADFSLHQVWYFG